MHERVATFDLVIRDMPVKRNYLVFAGLEEIVYHLLRWKFSGKQINFLLDGELVTPGFAKYMKKLRFTGEVKALPERTIFFPGEPVVRITATIIEASLIETFMMTMAVSNIVFTTKAARFRSVSPDIRTSIGLQRAHSFESGHKALRSSYICGLTNHVWSSFVDKYKLKHPKYVINAQHLFIKSFGNEMTAFKKMAKYFPNNTAVMIDTYDFDQGLANAITLAKQLKSQGDTLRYITVDAGDLIALTKKARRELDKNHLKEVGIIVASNLDEFKIKDLVSKKIPADLFIVNTEALASSDDPKLEVVYKISEIIQPDGTVVNKMKLAPGKMSLPGRKQVYRTFESGKMVNDTIGREKERGLGTPYSNRYLRKGNLFMTCLI